MVTAASGRPASAPSTHSARLSTSSWRTRWRRPAPIASRTAISFCRDQARASSRLATLAQAISTTRPTMPASTSSGVFSRCCSSGRPCPPGRNTSFFATNVVQELLRAARQLARLALERLPVDDGQRGLGLGDRDARLAPRHHLEPHRAPVAEAVPGRRHLRLHHERHEDVVRAADLGAVEPRRRDADDRQRHAVHVHRAAEDARVAAEPALPVAVADHHDRVRAGRAVVVGRQHAGPPPLRPRAPRSTCRRRASRSRAPCRHGRPRRTASGTARARR